ncbi:Transposon Ty3-I Gag-Pol polyprotein like [Argiope bruennichi]|uniref:Transposon Ty3-I Gag-Pol polyprotein like n=1 Tax=Argiope bruennichi TaxID=94029 RepID=A0A8T0FJ08_ARGBR|nr:Transposon Ty3-I Gag-Pol polyprotein like [Argiope bruennichi]
MLKIIVLVSELTLRKSGIVMVMKNNFWYFGDKPNCRIPFVKDIPLPTNNSPVETISSSCLTNSITSDGLLQNNPVAPETNNPRLRQDQNLAKTERTPKEIDKLLANDVIEECESPYVAQVILIPKPNGTIRLCVDYRKLNAITEPDKYPLPANPVERKNSDLKPRLTIMVGNNHTLWIQKLPAIRFSLNTAKCETTGCIAAYLNFSRELRTLDDVTTDLRSIIHNDNFVPEFTPYLKRIEKNMSQINENIEKSQVRRKAYADKSRKLSPNYKPDDLVWVKLHPLNKANQSKTAKFMPRKDGPYIILSRNHHLSNS